MNTILHYATLVAAVAAAGYLALENRTLSRDLAEARSAVAALSAPGLVVQSPAEREVVEVVRVETPAPTNAEEVAEERPVLTEEVLQKAVEVRMEENRKRREAERERRRQEWENQTPEEREARRQEFMARMQERSSKRLAEFVERTGLDDAQYGALEAEISWLDASVREVVDAWAAAIREGGAFGPDARMQLLNGLTAVAMEAYEGLDSALPASWREADGSFNLLQMVGPDAFAPLMDAARDAGLNPGAVGMVMGSLMGGGERGPRGNRGGPGGGGPGDNGGPPPGRPPF